MRPVQGAKGSSAPYEASDTLRSTQIAEIVDLLGEGPIGGLVNGLKSIYLDGVPVENADGSRNFAEFGYQLTLGGPTSEANHGFGDVQTEVGVGVTVLAAVPVVRTIADSTADAVRVTLTVPALVEQKDNGDRVGSSFEFAVDIQSNGGGYVTRLTDTISGKASAPYSRALRLSLTDVGPAPWDVRVRRITPDSASPSIVNAFAWASYTVISGVRMLYRNSAVARLTFDAKNFSAIPQRWYDVWGMNEWDIPLNYDPLARTTTGAWNGVFKQGPTNNPAWVLYNLVRQPRYGLADYAVQLPDKWTLYQLAAWCDAPLPDGRGGTEPRYSINAAIVEQSEALQLLQEICSTFRGVLMHGGDILTVTWDAPGTPVASYTPANVVDGLFTYADGSGGDRKTSCTCWYTDRTQAGKRVPVTWDDADLVAAHGLRPMEIRPLGVATPGQALRMAKWALFTAHYEAQTIAFRVGAEGPLRRLGEVFQVADPTEAGERLGGRIHAATTTQVTLDAPVVLAPGETYTLWVTQPHATDDARLVLEQRTVTTAAGTTALLTVSPAFSAAPLAGTVWLLEGSDVAPTLWRYVAINEVQGEGGRREYEVLGVRHEPGKWALIEADQPLTQRPTRRLPLGAPPVASITITEEVYFDAQGLPHIRAAVTWPHPAPGLRYVVTWRLDNGPWTTEPPVSSNTVQANDLQPGVYEVQVQSLNGLGQLSVATSATVVLVGDQSRPDNVAGLAFQIVAGGLRLSWLPDTQPGYEKTRLSYGATFATSVFFWEGNSTDFVVRPPADGTYLVWAVHVNKRGSPSLVPSSIEVPYVAAGSGTDGLNNATVRLYRRAPASPTPALPTAAVTYTFASGALSGLTEGWQGDIPAGTDPVWTIQAVASATTPTDSIGSAEWSAPVILAADGVDGASVPLVSLTAVPMVFVTPANSSTPAPASSTITATISNILSPAYAWTVDGVLQGYTGGALVLPSFPAGTSKLVQCTVTGSNGSAFDTITIFSLREGSDSIAAGLDNQNQTVACDAAGNPSPAGQFPLTAQAYTVRGATFLTTGVTYGIQAGSNSGFSSPSISSTGAVSIAGMTADVASVTFTATVGSTTIPMRFTANKSRAGASGLNTALIFAYRRNPTAPGGPSLACIYEFSSKTLTGLNNSWTTTIPAGTDPLWVVAATAASETDTDTIVSTDWTTPQQISGTNGTNGLNSATVYLYQRTSSATAPALPSSTLTYTFATGVLTGTLGAWSQTIPSGAGEYVHVTTATAVSSATTDTIPNTEWAAVRLIATAGSSGARGSLTLYSNSVSPVVNLSGTTWPDDTAGPTYGTNDNNASRIVWQALGNSAATFVSNSVAHLRIGDTVTLTNAGGTVSIAKFWTGDYWANPGTVISGNLLVGGTISGQVNLNIGGSASFEGANGISIPAPGSASPSVTYQTAVVANATLTQNIGIYAKSSSVSAVYGHNTSTSTSNAAVNGLGPIGVYGYASVAGGFGVKGQGGGNTGTAGVHGQNSGSGDGVVAVYVGLGGGNALRAIGSSVFEGRITSTVSGNVVSVVLPRVTAKPTAIAGGVCLHNTLGLIVSDGTNWFGPAGGLVVV